MIASRLEGSSVDEVISITEVVPEMPSSKNCESAFWSPRPLLNPKQRYGFGLLRSRCCSVGKPSSCLAQRFGQMLFEQSIQRRA